MSNLKKSKTPEQAWDNAAHKLCVYILEGIYVGNNPVFHNLLMLFSSEPTENDTIKLEVYEVSRISDVLLGEVSIPNLTKLQKERVIDQWYEVSGKKLNGKIHIRMYYSTMTESRNTHEQIHNHHDFFYKAIRDNIKTGDLIGYSGTGLVAAVSKLHSYCEISHLGLVVALPNKWTNEEELYVMEVTRNSGVCVDFLRETFNVSVKNKYSLCDFYNPYFIATALKVGGVLKREKPKLMDTKAVASLPCLQKPVIIRKTTTNLKPTSKAKVFYPTQRPNYQQNETGAPDTNSDPNSVLQPVLLRSFMQTAQLVAAHQSTSTTSLTGSGESNESPASAIKPQHAEKMSASEPLTKPKKSKAPSNSFLTVKTPPSNRRASSSASQLFAQLESTKNSEVPELQSVLNHHRQTDSPLPIRASNSETSNLNENEMSPVPVRKPTSVILPAKPRPVSTCIKSQEYSGSPTTLFAQENPVPFQVQPAPVVTQTQGATIAPAMNYQFYNPNLQMSQQFQYGTPPVQNPPVQFYYPNFIHNQPIPNPGFHVINPPPMAGQNVYSPQVSKYPHDNANPMYSSLQAFPSNPSSPIPPSMEETNPQRKVQRVQVEVVNPPSIHTHESISYVQLDE